MLGDLLTVLLVLFVGGILVALLWGEYQKGKVVKLTQALDDCEEKEIDSENETAARALSDNELDQDLAVRRARLRPPPPRKPDQS